MNMWYLYYQEEGDPPLISENSKKIELPHRFKPDDMEEVRKWAYERVRKVLTPKGAVDARLVYVEFIACDHIIAKRPSKGHAPNPC